MQIKLIFAVLFCLPVMALAEPITSTAPKIFEIEVMVFQNILPDLEGDELWTADDAENVIKDIDKAAVVSGAPQASSALSKAQEILDSDSDYRVLVHKQWIQNADVPADAELIRLKTEEGDLDGSFKFYMSRFLHIELNLVYSEQESRSIFKTTDSGDSDWMAYRLQEQRRVRSNEIEYFDHPKFGVLVLVTPIRVDLN